MTDSVLTEIKPNLYAINVPLPDNPLRALNAYLITAPDKTTIIDVGFNHPACEEALNCALKEVGRTWESVEIVLTHAHPDHTANLDRIWRPGMRIYAHLHSFQEVKNLLDLQATVFNPLLCHLTDAKACDTPTMQRRDARTYRLTAEFLPLKHRPPVTYITDGDTYTSGDYTFRILSTPGHEDCHIVLYDEEHRILIAGDHILERITPLIMSWIPSYDALREFFSSLDKVRDLDVDLILPGHGKPFSGLADRVDFLKGFHRNRLEELVGVIESGHTELVDIAKSATWKYPNWDEWPLDQKFYATGETFAHLIYLVTAGKLSMTTCATHREFAIAKW